MGKYISKERKFTLASQRRRIDMAQVVCSHCAAIFDGSPRHKNQAYCMKPKCRKAKKAQWQRHKMQTDPDYRFNQRLSNKKWASANPGYWKVYRRKNPEKAQRNTILQSIRNRRARAKKAGAKMDASLFIAKMDALKVNIIPLSKASP
jgi:hypothetical protein